MAGEVAVGFRQAEAQLPRGSRTPRVSDSTASPCRESISLRPALSAALSMLIMALCLCWLLVTGNKKPPAGSQGAVCGRSVCLFGL